MSKAQKGGGFERQVAVQLSEWWTQDLPEPRTDIFWRSSNSGGRATTRKKTGKTTAGQYGDLSAIDPIGKPLLDLLAIELKRGYSQDHIANLLDKKETSKQQTYESWFEKVIRSQIHSGAFAWLLIVRRDQRDAFCFFPFRFQYSFNQWCDKTFNSSPYLRLDLTIRFEELEFKGRKEIDEGIVGIRLDHFLNTVNPKDVIAILQGIKESKNGNETDLSQL